MLADVQFDENLRQKIHLLKVVTAPVSLKILQNLWDPKLQDAPTLQEIKQWFPDISQEGIRFHLTRLRVNMILDYTHMGHETCYFIHARISPFVTHLLDSIFREEE